MYRYVLNFITVRIFFVELTMISLINLFLSAQMNLVQRAQCADSNEMTLRQTLDQLDQISEKGSFLPHVYIKIGCCCCCCLVSSKN